MIVDIVNLIESNPITKLNGNYQCKLIEKIKNNFKNYEQQLFLSSFYFSNKMSSFESNISAKNNEINLQNNFSEKAYFILPEINFFLFFTCLF